MAELFTLDEIKFEDNEKKTFGDPRLYRIKRDSDGNAQVTFRILPDQMSRSATRLFKVNPNITKDGVQRFVSVTSPQTINARCPFHEHWQNLWNSGDKEEARKFSRSERYAMNVMIVKDVNAPENNGKFFIFEFPKTVYNELMEIIRPSDEDIQPKNLFAPIKGHTVKLSQETVGGIPRYKKLVVLEGEKENPFDQYKIKSRADWDEFLKEHTYDLDEYKNSIIKSYDELVKDLNFVLFNDTEENDEVVNKTDKVDEAVNVEFEDESKPVKKSKKAKDKLDDILDSL